MAPSRLTVPSFKPDLSPADFDYIKDILRSGHVAQGPLAQKLESEVSFSIGVRHGIATSSGTSALHLALLAVGVHPGDRVLIPAFSCAALAHAVHHAGAQPILMDIDPMALNPDPDMARKALRARTKAIVLTHTSGYPVPIKRFRTLGIPIVEDCCLSAGAEIGGRPAGSFGDAAVFSFHATKPACGGSGGMACTNDSGVAARLRDLNEYDQRRDYRVRYNYKMSDLTAGLALAQWKRLPEFLYRRRELAGLYLKALDLPKEALPRLFAGAKPSYHHFLIRVLKTADFIRESRQAGISCERPVFKPLNRYFSQNGSLPGTEEAWRTLSTIPLYPALTEAQAQKVIKAVKPLLSRRLPHGD